MRPLRPAVTKKGKPRLVMTLLVRDEIDLIRRNLEHHLAAGVDFIVATDNGSVDGTREVLLEYQRRGVLHLIDEPAKDFQQAAWVNRMGRLACEEFGADVIFHCDADEFWYALSRDLTREITRGFAHARYAHSFSVHLADRGGQETLADAVWVAFEPVNLADNAANRGGPPAAATKSSAATPSPRIKKKRRLQPGLGKVITNTRDGYLEVTTGNHRLASGEPLEWSRDVYLLHYPVRSYEQFKRKVVAGGAAVMDNPELGPREAVHWKQWYAHYLEGRLEEDYRALLIRDPDIYVKQGVMVDLRALSTAEFAATVREAIRRRTRRPPLLVRGRQLAGRLAHPLRGDS